MQGPLREGPRGVPTCCFDVRAPESRCLPHRNPQAHLLFAPPPHPATGDETHHHLTAARRRDQTANMREIVRVDPFPLPPRAGEETRGPRVHPRPINIADLLTVLQVHLQTGQCVSHHVQERALGRGADLLCRATKSVPLSGRTSPASTVSTALACTCSSSTSSGSSSSSSEACTE